MRRKAILNSLAIQGEKGKLYLTAQCGFNIGASLGGFLVGAIIDRFSWSAVFIVLAIGAILTSVLLVSFAFWINKLSGKSILSLEQSVL